MEGRKHRKEGAFDGFRNFAAARGAGKDFEDPLVRAWGFCLKKRGQKQRAEGIQVPPFRSQVDFKGITRGEGDVRREGGEGRKRHGLGVRGNFRRQNGNLGRRKEVKDARFLRVEGLEDIKGEDPDVGPASGQ